MLSGVGYDRVHSAAVKNLKKRRDLPGRPWPGLTPLSFLSLTERFIGRNRLWAVKDPQALFALKRRAIAVVEYNGPGVSHAVLVTETGRIIDPLPKQWRSHAVTKKFLRERLLFALVLC